MSKEILEIFEWYKQFDKKDIKIKSETKEFDIEITNIALPHLLGLHYINDANTHLKGRALYNYVKSNNFTDEEIFEKIRNNNRGKLTDVRNRVETFEKFMKNLEKGYLFEQTNQNTQIKSNYLIVQTKDNYFLHLGIKQEEISDYITDFSVEIYKETKDVLETYLVQRNMNYFDKSTIFEEITDLKVYNEETTEYVPFSFDERKNEELLKAFEEKENFNYKEAINEYENKEKNNKEKKQKTKIKDTEEKER